MFFTCPVPYEPFWTSNVSMSSNNRLLIGFSNLDVRTGIPHRSTYVTLSGFRPYHGQRLPTARMLIFSQGDSEELIGKWFVRTGNRDKIFLATKFGIDRSIPGKSTTRGDPDFVRQTVETSLKRLQTEYVDLLYQHRPDGKVPIEVTVRAMKEYVECVFQ